MSSEPPAPSRLELDRDSYAAGDVVSGVVVGLEEPSTVVLVRLERDPSRCLFFEITEAQASPSEPRFGLTLPSTAVPSTRGRQCRLAYAVRVRGDPRGVGADLAVTATARPHLDTDSWRSDRLLANWDARHFHIELGDARLEGSGRIAGRVHRHGTWPPGAIDITARCLECWRAHALASPSAPQWRRSALWEQVCRLRIDHDATWAPFVFELPDGLPPAVEAARLAWRYELIAQRNVRHWFSETAAVTPLDHEHIHPTA